VCPLGKCTQVDVLTPGGSSRNSGGLHLAIGPVSSELGALDSGLANGESLFDVTTYVGSHGGQQLSHRGRSTSGRGRVKDTKHANLTVSTNRALEVGGLGAVHDLVDLKSMSGKVYNEVCHSTYS